jgi:hypothetical protein
MRLVQKRREKWPRKYKSVLSELAKIGVSERVATQIYSLLHYQWYLQEEGFPHGRGDVVAFLLAQDALMEAGEEITASAIAPIFGWERM